MLPFSNLFTLIPYIPLPHLQPQLPPLPTWRPLDLLKFVQYGDPPPAPPFPPDLFKLLHFGGDCKARIRNFDKRGSHNWPKFNRYDGNVALFGFKNVRFWCPLQKKSIPEPLLKITGRNHSKFILLKKKPPQTLQMKLEQCFLNP